MKRIRVPEFLVSAIMSKTLVVAACNGKAVEISEPVAREVARRICEALSENPQVPTDEQLQEIDSECSSEREGWKTHPLTANIIEAWQRRCFVQEEPEEAQCSVCNSPIWKVENGMWSHWGGYPDHQASPEPEIPAEIKDLLWSGKVIQPADETIEENDRRICEAFRRGLRKGDKR